MDITGIQSREIRESLNLSQNKTAQDSKVNRGYLSMFEADIFQLPDHYKQQLINFYGSQGYLFTQNEEFFDNEHIDKPIEEKDGDYYFEEKGCTGDNNATFNAEKEEITTSKISTNPKLANTILLITTLTIFHQIAKRNGFNIFDWISNKLPSKKGDDIYRNEFY
jgi:transcriptional regulator with XRE-family HTH domain